MSLVNQMLCDLELRQSGQPAADRGVLCDMTAVHEPLSDGRRAASWRPAVLLAVVTGVALTVAAPRLLPGPWSTSTGAPSAVAAPARFSSAVVPVVTPRVDSSDDRHPPAEPRVAAARPRPATARAAVAEWAGLRIARELLVPRPTTAGGAAHEAAVAPAVAPRPGKSALPDDLHAVAERFDREFAVALGETRETGDDPPPAPPAVVASTPLKVKTIVHRSAAERGSALYEAASAALLAGGRDEAERGLVAALHTDPAHAGARRLLATLLMQTGRFDAAERLLAQASPVVPALAGLRARALVELGRDAEALAVLEAGLGDDADIELLAFHATLMQRLGDHAGASSVYRRVLATQPGNGTWWTGLGISLEAMTQPDEARRAYQRARAAGPLQQTLAEFVERRLAAL